MGKLMKAEFYKLQKLPSVRMIFLFALVVGVTRGLFPYSGYQVYIIGLVPELLDMALISVFTAAFLCTEFSQRTFAAAFFCGNSRQTVFLAKLAVYFPGLLLLILFPLAVSTFVATMRNGFGADWDEVALEMVLKILFYIFHRFFMAAFSILIASIIWNPIAVLGFSTAGIYLLSLTQNPMNHWYIQTDLPAFLIKTVFLLSAATFIFVRRDLH